MYENHFLNYSFRSVNAYSITPFNKILKINYIDLHQSNTWPRRIIPVRLHHHHRSKKRHKYIFLFNYNRKYTFRFDFFSIRFFFCTTHKIYNFCQNLTPFKFNITARDNMRAFIFFLIQNNIWLVINHPRAYFFIIFFILWLWTKNEQKIFFFLDWLPIF